MTEYNLFAKNRLRSNIFDGICYGGFRDGQNPITGIFPSEAEVRDDMQLIKNCPAIRIYGCQDPGNYVNVANDFGIQVLVGAWLDSNLLKNKKEINKISQIANNVSNIKAILAGNRVLTSKFFSVEQTIDYIKIFQKLFKYEISTSEKWKVWLDTPKLAKQADFIGLFIFPFSNGIAIDKAIDFLDEKINLLKVKYPNKKIVITDTGWPSAGQTVGKAVPSEENQIKYINEINKYFHKTKLEYYFFEAFDESWKRIEEKEIGAHWGIFTTKRKAKSY